MHQEAITRNIHRTGCILVVLTNFLFSSCGRSPSIPLLDETPQDEYFIDSLPGYLDPPCELDEGKLAVLVEDIAEGDYGKIHSLIIIHYDSLVVEEYFMGWTRHMLQPLFSVTKSFSSALVGIAIEQGYINGVDEELLSFFPEYSDIANLDERKKSITLEHVLTMSAGFQWNPFLDEYGNPNPENDTAKMVESGNWIKYVLDMPMCDDPGTKFLYNNGESHLLSGILTNKTGQSAEEFAEENLFSKIGITKWEWKTDPRGLADTAGVCGGLFIHPVNMAMFGYLYLNNGLLDGIQVVPAAWVKESTSKLIERRDPASGEINGYYGYQWWVNSDNAYCAIGKAGQFIFVMPDLHMVVVITAANLENTMGRGTDIVNNIVNALIVK